MEEKKRIVDDIAFTYSVKMLAQAYEEIAVIKMRQIRNAVIHTRDFLSSLADVFVNAKSTYRNRLIADAKRRKHSPANILHISTRKTNGRKLIVFLSANNKLYGDLISRIFFRFRDVVKKTPEADIVIVGKLGRGFYQKTKFDRRAFTFFDIPDTQQDMEQLKPLMQLLLTYEEITVIYGKFLNIVSQEATAMNLSGDEPLQPQRDIKQYDFLYEPSIEKVLAFFETQIFSALFRQTLHEAELARYASRVNAMESATQFITQRITHLEHMQRRIDHLIENKKQQERLSGMLLWKR